MCGIAGLADFREPMLGARQVVDVMNTALRHRGPDGDGIYESPMGHVVLGNRLLSIVDVRHGKQPIHRTKDGADLAITFNGEIYNHNDLRKELIQRGHRFATSCDSEVALVAYSEWGNDCVQHFNGCFAFAVYDGATKSLYLARDRVGIRPLFYAWLPDGRFAFASEPKGILAIPGYTPSPDFETIAGFFLEMAVLTDACSCLDRSFYDGINSLNPGSYATADASGFTCHSYWDVPIEACSERASWYERVASVRESLCRSVAARMPKEVNGGVGLSGGVDSSVLAVLASSEIGHPVPCFSIQYMGGYNPDFEHARLLASEHSLPLEPVDVVSEALIQDVDPMIHAMDGPHDTIRQLGMFAMFRSFREAKFKVALVGEGGDEFHLGYYHTSPGFAHDQHVCRNGADFRALWRKRIPFASAYLARGFREGVDYEAIIERVVSEYYDACPSEGTLEKMQYFYAKKFLKYRLDANDRCGFAHSVEVRVPYCDHDAIQASLAVPSECNLGKDTEKIALREAFRDELPMQIRSRRKFSMAESPVLRAHRLVADMLRAELRSAGGAVWSILDREHTESLLNLYAKRIDDIERSKQEDATALTDEIPLSRPVSLRTRHVFSVLTFIRWFRTIFRE